MSGCIKIRQHRAISDKVTMEHIKHYEGWTDLQTIVRVKRQTRSGDKAT